jgi:DNA-directed RNA polymerase specialized sigma24 family protein
MLALLAQQGDRVPWDSRSACFNYFLTVIQNAFIDHCREKGALKRGRGLSIVALDGREMGGTPDPLRVLLGKEARDLVDRILQRWDRRSPRRALIFRLRYFEDKTLKEIAVHPLVRRNDQSIEENVKALRNSLAYARRLLRRELENEYGSGEQG